MAHDYMRICQRKFSSIHSLKWSLPLVGAYFRFKYAVS
ncbi:hypothetical protein BH160DRAFT_0568 [Burkholderia sp. H160]|nr:hypothetical protein BH160DRAFT_0568 [Burkholderia sp. H160]